MIKYIKSASSTEKQKLDIRSSPKNDNPTVIKSHGDSHRSKSKSSSKSSFCGFPVTSTGIENLFEAMDLYNKSNSLIISVNLCSIINMIQLSSLDPQEFGNMFSRQDLRDSVFQDSIIEGTCLRKCFKKLFEKNLVWMNMQI
jgi:hypothetical protein